MKSRETKTAKLLRAENEHKEDIGNLSNGEEDRKRKESEHKEDLSNGEELCPRAKIEVFPTLTRRGASSSSEALVLKGPPPPREPKVQRGHPLPLGHLKSKKAAPALRKPKSEGAPPFLVLNEHFQRKSRKLQKTSYFRILFFKCVITKTRTFSFHSEKLIMYHFERGGRSDKRNLSTSSWSLLTVHHHCSFPCVFPMVAIVRPGAQHGAGIVFVYR